MADAKLIVHVGGAKCGSSALQTTLSHNDLSTNDGGRVVYAALHEELGVIYDDKLRHRARRSPHGYVASLAPKKIEALDAASKKKMFDGLLKLSATYDYVILSNEGWLQQVDLLSKNGFFNVLNIPFEVFAAVRPQVDYMNSAWWQWGAWSHFSLENWVNRHLQSVQWFKQLEKWRNQPGCLDVKLRLLTRDIAGDFCKAFRLTYTCSERSDRHPNTSLPGELLRLYQRHPSLRKRPDLSAIDFVLAKYELGSEPTPWVIDQDLCKKIISSCRKDNEALCKTLPQLQADLMRDTKKWWSHEAYKGKEAQSPLPQPADPDKTDRLCAELAQALFDADMQLRKPKT